jgi:hypothetical protein
MGYYTTLILIVLGCICLLYFMRYMFDILWWLLKASMWVIALMVVLKMVAMFFSGLHV